MDWTQYVKSTAEPYNSQRDIVERTGLDQTTISRWLNGKRVSLTPNSVARFARGYGRPLLEAFVVAGFLTEGEARVRTIKPRTLDGFTSNELARELTRRTRADAAS